MVTKKPAKKTSRKTMSAKEKKAQLEKKTKEALKAVNTLMKSLKKDIVRQFGQVKIKYRDGAVVRKMKRDAAFQLRKIAAAIEGRKTRK